MIRPVHRRRQRKARPEPGPGSTAALLEELEAEWMEPHRRTPRWFVCLQWLLILGLTLGLVLQWLWFKRDMLLPDYPQMRPYVQSLCVRLGCRLIRNRDIGAIRLLAREVRAHPRYRHSIVAEATLLNTLPTVQSWPIIQLLITDRHGRVVGSGKFPPGSYLDTAVRREQGMPPWRSVQVRLEVYGDMRQGSGFQLHFL